MLHSRVRQLQTSYWKHGHAVHVPFAMHSVAHAFRRTTTTATIITAVAIFCRFHTIEHRTHIPSRRSVPVLKKTNPNEQTTRQGRVTWSVVLGVGGRGQATVTGSRSTNDVPAHFFISAAHTVCFADQRRACCASPKPDSPRLPFTPSVACHLLLSWPPLATSLMGPLGTE